MPVKLKPWTYISQGALLGRQVKIKKGKTTFLDWGAFIFGDVELGKGCLISPNAVIISIHHETTKGIPIADIKTTEKKVIIGDYVWIGAGAVILGGNTIGDGAIIGAGSVLTEDHIVGENEIWVGNPCKFLKNRV